MADPRSGTGPVIRSIEFYNIELAPLADGRVYVSMLATTVDDEEPQLLTQEIACDTVATIEDALAVIRQGVAGPVPALSDPAVVGGRTTMSRRQSRRLVSFGTMVQITSPERLAALCRAQLRTHDFTFGPCP